MADEWKTIRVPKSVYDDAKMRKQEHGVTWGEYVNPHAWHSVFDEPKEVGEKLTTTVEVDTDEIVDKILSQLSENVSIQVDMAEYQGMDEQDVKNLIESHLEQEFAEMRGY